MHIVPPGRKARMAGMSLVELLIGAVIAMIASIFMLQLFTVTEGQQRNVTSGADATTNGQVGLFQIERDLRMAGLALGSMTCSEVVMFSAVDGTVKSLSLYPVLITKDEAYLASATDYVPDDSDQIEVLYSASPLGALPSTIQVAMPDSSAILRVDDGHGFYEGELVLLGSPSSPSKHCSVVQMSQDGQKTGTGSASGGTMWNLQHNPGGSFPYNPPGGQNIFPTGGYVAGDLAFRLGAMVHQRYRIEGENLVVDDLTDPAATVTLTLVSGVVALKAEYAVDTTAPEPDGVADAFWTRGEMDALIAAGTPIAANRVVGVRIGLVVRSQQYDRDYTSPFANGQTLWDGGPTLTIAGTYGPNYRYSVLQTTVPFRNVIWNSR